MSDQTRSRANTAQPSDTGRSPQSARLPSAPQPAQTDTKFQLLLESAPDAIVIVDRAGRITIVNSQAERLFGYDRDMLIGQPIEIMLPERLHDRHAGHRAGYIGEPHTRPMGIGLDLVARRRDGSEFPVEVSLSPLQTEDGMLVTSVIRDITDRKHAADELERQVQRRTAHLNALLDFSQELLLQRRGYTVTTARSGTEALALIEQQPFELLLLDLKMPGLSGLEVAQRAREVQPAAAFSF